MRVAETKHVLIVGAGTFGMSGKLFGLFRVGSLQRRYATTFMRRKGYIDYPEFSTTQ